MLWLKWKHVACPPAHELQSQKVWTSFSGAEHRFVAVSYATLLCLLIVENYTGSFSLRIWVCVCLCVCSMSCAQLKNFNQILTHAHTSYKKKTLQMEKQTIKYERANNNMQIIFILLKCE